MIAGFNGDRVIGGLTAYEFRKYKRETKEIYLYEIGVEKSQGRKGAARKLIEFLKQICREKSIEKIFVGAYQNNFPAIKLYEATGGRGAKVIEFEYEINLDYE